MNTSTKKISPALFSLTLICFFLPFITISCRQEPLVTLNGVEVATGKEIQSPSIFGEPVRKEKIPGEPLAALAFLSGAIGLGTSFLKAKKSAVIPAGCGAAGFILLLIVKSKIDNEILKQGQGLILVNYGFGFWLAFFLFICATLINIYIVVQDQDENKLDSTDVK
ncbi:MAG: hypothetical protein C6Y22_11280 [Hapalosiphonaceae cyanobacterium JJU2]|nr:MAG: hypothetical protein C6Y22_11280 [Hapalosiphonaceae cyanobacterium JJU2]